MKDVLEKEILGAPVAVEIRGITHPLAYPMHNVILYKHATGDSLFDAKSWPRIDLQADPERWLACLWAGLHEQQPDKSWKAPYTFEELGGLIDFGNAAQISIEMVNALTAYMPKQKEPSPNAPAPGLPQESQPAQTTPAPTSASSTPGQNAGSGSTGTSS